MEFTRRELKKSKAKYARAKKEAGYRRIVVRGRKRWVKVESEAAKQFNAVIVY